MTIRGASRRRLLAAGLLLAALPAWPAGADDLPAVRVSARLVDRAEGAEAGWGATGQVLLPAPADDPAQSHWHGARVVATSSAVQEVRVAVGGRGEIRVGREIPFVGWFLRRARAEGLVEADAEWRDVEALLALEVLAPSGGGAAARIALTPELAFTQGRSRRSLTFAGARVELALPLGREARLAVAPELEDFYARLLAGYDPLRRVRPAELLLEVSPAGEDPTP